MLEKIKKRVNISKKITFWIGILIFGLGIALTVIYKEYWYIVGIFTMILFLISLFCLGIDSRCVIKDINYNDDKITFISSIFFNYLFVNDELKQRKFAVINYMNFMKTDYNNQTLKVMFTHRRRRHGKDVEVNFFLDGEQIRNIKVLEKD